MSSQILLSETLSIVSQNITITPAEYAALSNAIYYSSVQFGYIAFFIGAVLGFWIGYTVCEYRRDKEDP